MLSSLDPKAMIAIYPIVTREPVGTEVGPQEVTSGVPVRTTLAELAVWIQDYTPPA